MVLQPHLDELTRIEVDLLKRKASDDKKKTRAINADLLDWLLAIDASLT